MQLKIPAGTFHAYLFDCDGTIADSMPLHYVAWRSASLGLISISKEVGQEFRENLGQTALENASIEALACRISRVS
jgi:beta-phosphoglucomutase-like phosphatase (HAD superfamily)